MKTQTIEVRNLRETTRAGVHRATAEVAGAELWFESRDLPLRASVEAVCSAMLIPALFHQSPLKVTQEVCPQWLQQAREVVGIVGRWWRYPALMPEAPVRVTPSRPRNAGTAMCFSGGLDSFHSLLKSRHRPDLLVCVQGYDMALEDGVRFEAFRPSLRSVAETCGARPVVIRTNLRQHPVFAAAPWHHTHGGALAAIGHLLGEHAGRLVVASSVPPTCTEPWGSHWQLDPLWSSRELEIVHEGAEFSRAQKAWSMAGEPLMFQHLRVCWENRTPTGNCSACDKCVCTMLLLEQAGQLDNYVVFQRPQSFVKLLEALPRTQYPITYREMCQRGLNPQVQAAVERLLRRTVDTPAQRTAVKWLWRQAGKLTRT
jgi:hypothetical protein